MWRQLKNALTTDLFQRGEKPELLHPGPENKRRFLKWFLPALIFAALLVALKSLLFQHIDSLPACERISWIRWMLVALGALPTVAAALTLPQAIAMLNAEQWPRPDAAIFAPTRIRRGRALRIRAGLLLAWCLICAPFPLYGYFVLKKWFFNPAAEHNCRGAENSISFQPISTHEQPH
jgi:hypothetical protein